MLECVLILAFKVDKRRGGSFESVPLRCSIIFAIFASQGFLTILEIDQRLTVKLLQPLIGSVVR